MTSKQFGLYLSLLLVGPVVCYPAQWNLVPDDFGKLHLVATDPDPLQLDNEPAFDPETDVIFRLFTRSNPQAAQIVQWNDPQSLRDSYFNSNHPTRFTIHGWVSGEDANLHGLIRENLLAMGDFNVINVDWGAGAQTINYIQARNRVGAVGEMVSRFIDMLVETTGATHDSISVTGSSLGAHCAGNAGKFQNGRINTIIGMDPAGPLFSLGQPDILSETDGQYVEAIYTNSGLLGFDLPLGHANFYPNGGRTQPGCGIDITGNCAHTRAHQYFAESIGSPLGFVGVRCASHQEILEGLCTESGPTALMGGEPSNYGRGVSGYYHLLTNEQSPFARG
ncbi:pancreatic triacylglycerol lipase-like [Sabethes cyaneus]|uniref:pancreatic triacylglycerol lipase-like n=1 Tax=Sabethes cyaneus TaxID=53552 RepID=UPI00237E025F|nr:pancreatic triacylglycerol lipase-like [Sabethes cyaneus]